MKITRSVKQITTGIILLSIFLPSLAYAKSIAYSDVSSSHKNAKAIEFISELEGAQTTDSFRPSDNTTLNEFLKITLLSLGYKPSEEEKKAKSRCSDVKEKESIPYFNKAIEARLFSPSSKKCNPNKTISRLEGLRFTFAAYGIPTPSLSSNKVKFKDVNENASFYPLINKNAELNLLPPESEDYFRPYKKIIRAHSAELIYQAHQYTFTDSSGEDPEESPSTQVDPQTIELSQIPKIDIFLDIWKKLNADYYYLEKEDLSEEDFIYNALEGLAKTVADPYTEFQKPSDAVDLQSSLSGEIEGIGTNLIEKDGKIVIISVIKDSPADKIGIKAKDEILKVDGKDIGNLELEEVSEKIRGAKGTQVKLTIFRPSDGTTKDFTITRDIIEIPYIEAQIIEKNIGYIELSLFAENTAQDFLVALDSLEQYKIQGLIIDVRNNPGGYLTSVINILEHFIDKGKPLTGIRYPSGTTYLEYSEGEGEISKKYPIVVIANEGSASAAEIFAAALQEYSIATIIGTQTYGKGTVQELNTYDDGSIFKITIAEWVTPSAKSLEGKGVKPDIMIEITSSDLANEKDPQLDRAVEEMKKKM